LTKFEDGVINNKMRTSNLMLKTLSPILDHGLEEGQLWSGVFIPLIAIA